MLRNSSQETIDAVLGHIDPDLQRQLQLVEGAPPEVPDSLNNALLHNLVTSMTASYANVHLPVIDCSYGAEMLNDDGSKIRINGLDVKPSDTLESVLSEHNIYTTWQVKEEEGFSGVDLETDFPGTFDLCEASVAVHKHIYVQRIFNQQAFDRLFTGLHEAGLISLKYKSMVDKVGFSYVRAPWHVKPNGEAQPSH